MARSEASMPEGAELDAPAFFPFQKPRATVCAYDASLTFAQPDLAEGGQVELFCYPELVIFQVNIICKKSTFLPSALSAKSLTIIFSFCEKKHS